MTDPRQTEEERTRLLLSAAAEPERPPVPPGAEFTARARRSLLRRRLVLTAAGVSAAAVLVTGALAIGKFVRGDDPTPASAPCVRSVADRIRQRQAQGFWPVYGTLRNGRVPMDDGVTKSSAFRFGIDGALTHGATVPAAGAVTVWYPVSEAQLPRPGRYLLLLKRAARPSTSQQLLFDMAPQPSLVLPMRDDGRLTVRCGNGDGVVERERLRAALDRP